jgi:hypothetical protein
MPAVYPSAIKTFTRRRDLLDVILAADVNQVYDEVTEMQTVMGITITAKPAGWSGGTFATDTSWSTLKARIENIEAGVYTAFTNRIQSSGGSTITPSSTSTIGIILQAISSQTSDLLQAKTSGGTTVARIDKDGVLRSGNNAVATVVGAETLTNKTISGATNTLTNIAPSSVIVTGSTDIQEYVDARPTVYYQSSEPTGVIAGTIWIDSSTNVDPFDPSGVILSADPSPTSTSSGYRRITASTSAPTSGDGANGDVWLQYV